MPEGLWRMRKVGEDHGTLPVHSLLYSCVAPSWNSGKLLEDLWIHVLLGDGIWSFKQCSPVGMALPPAIFLCRWECMWHLVQLMGMDGPERVTAGVSHWLTLSHWEWVNMSGVRQFQEDPVGFQTLWESLEKDFGHSCKVSNPAHVRSPQHHCCWL